MTCNIYLIQTVSATDMSEHLPSQDVQQLIKDQSISELNIITQKYYPPPQPPQQSSLPHLQSDNSKIRHLCCGYYSNPQLYVFVPTFIIAILIVIMLWTKVFIEGWHLYIGRFLCLYVLYRFLSLAFSDPGQAKYDGVIPARLQQSYRRVQQNNPNRFCRQCKIYRLKFMQHCNICNICIQDYDHHCVFIGKCIGRFNIFQFKDFLCTMFSTLIYGVVVAVLVSSSHLKQAQAQVHNIQSHNPS